MTSIINFVANQKRKKENLKEILVEESVSAIIKMIYTFFNILRPKGFLINIYDAT